MPITNEEIRDDMVRLFKMMKDLRTDFEAMHNRYIDAERQYEVNVAEAGNLSFPLSVKLDRMEKVIKAFQEAVYKELGVESGTS